MTATLTPALALDYVLALSADVRAAVILDADGRLLAGPPGLEAPAKALLGAHAATALEGRTEEGAAFAVRNDEHAIVAVTGPHALPTLTLHDLRSALSALGRGTAPEGRPQRVAETGVNALLSVISAP